MRKVASYVLIVLLAAMVLPACSSGDKEATKEADKKPAPPPEPTAEQIHGELRNSLQPLWNALQPRRGLSKPDRELALNNLRAVIGKYGNSEHGKEGIDKLASDLEALIKQAKNEERWHLTKGAIMAYAIIRPGDEKYKSTEKKAELLMARPIVLVRGFFNVEGSKNGELIAFLECKDLETGKIKTEKVREGQDFYDGKLRLVRIIGNQQSVEVLYKAADSTWIVKGIRDADRPIQRG